MADYKIIKDYVGPYFRGEIVPEELLGDVVAMEAEGTIIDASSGAPWLPSPGEQEALDAWEASEDAREASEAANPILIGDPFQGMGEWPNKGGGANEQPSALMGGGDAAPEPHTAVSVTREVSQKPKAKTKPAHAGGGKGNKEDVTNG